MTAKDILNSREFKEGMAEIIAKLSAKEYERGYRDGYSDGVNDTKAKFKRVASKALRSGFSEGGKAMNNLK